MTILQWFNMVAAFAFAFACIWRLRNNHFKRYLDSPRLWWSMTLAIHMAAFYIATELNSTGIYDLPHMNFWSSVLRLHSLSTLIAIELVEIIYYLNKAKPHG